jgi:hypothetical protein
MPSDANPIKICQRITKLQPSIVSYEGAFCGKETEWDIFCLSLKTLDTYNFMFHPMPQYFYPSSGKKYIIGYFIWCLRRQYYKYTINTSS